MLRQLRGLGIQKAVMMTGDNDRTASVIAKQVGVDAYYAEVLPEDQEPALSMPKGRRPHRHHAGGRHQRLPGPVCC